MSKNEDETKQEDPFLARESMDYVHCPECYGEMMVDAPVCPHCGATHSDTTDTNTKQQNKPIYYLMLFLIGSGAAIILAGLFFDFVGVGMIIGGVLLLAASLIKRFT